ncbi:MarR family transcriptional regulator [Marixanthomonas sp. SCSIO 43207]|uniref:MarR family winged helix-turn-helix transcriptional regulator n=1 Tax=Marixanthomonas sp. SCSIO 43207 TaxID=2779360 RepID=UPI001CA9E65E|nr:MarR family transcriptional regulator [Marixanthomonas sp. SCSIO 43207]UAB79999.1 MarR family transcriptional regulator [Marixanthomonas sp. SCSIO 43207]
MKIEEVIKTRQPMEVATKTVINLMYTSRVVEEAVTSIFKEYNLTNQQYNVLRILRGQKNKPANLSTLQERMIDRSSNTTRLVDKLIQKKLVTRNVCPDNRRKVEISITETGLDILEKLDPITSQTNKDVLQNLNSEELKTLNNLLDKLRNDE